ncbi:hypothetical protein D3C71_2213510 [compost metagenome]
MAGSGGLFHHGGVLLGALINAVDGLVDLLNAGGLLAGGLDDGRHVLVDVIDLANDAFQ